MRIHAFSRYCLVGMAGLALVQADAADFPNQSNIRDIRDQRVSSPRNYEQPAQSSDDLQRSIWLSALSGMKVRNNQNQEIGTVDTVLIDLSQGTAPYVIVNTRPGFFGLGARSAAVPSEHFRREPYRNYLETDLTQSRISSFPQTDAKSRDNEDWNQLVREYRAALGIQDPLRNSIVDMARNVVMLRRGDDIMNEDVYSVANEKLGQVENFLVHLEKGLAILASIQPADSEKDIAVPPLLFQSTPVGEDLQVNTTAERLAAAPLTDLSQSTLSSELASLYRHFELRPSAALASLLQGSASDLTRDSDRTYARNQVDRDRDAGWDRTESERIRQPRSEPASDRYNTRSRSEPTADRDLDQDLGDDRISFPTGSQRAERQEGAKDLRDERVLWSDQLKGKEARNYQGRSLGRIEDLVLDLDNDVITHAVLSQGGVLGFGSKRTLVPLSLLRAGENTSFYLIDISEQELDRAPRLDSNDWRQGSRERWLRSVNDYYREMFPKLRDPSARRDARSGQVSLGYALLSDFIGKPVQYPRGGSAGEIRDIRLDLNRGQLLNVLISPDSDPRSWRTYSVQEITADGPERFFVNSSQTTRDLDTNSDGRIDNNRRPVREYNYERDR